MMLAGFLGLAILTIKLFPGIPLSLTLHRAFVEWPLEVAGRLNRRHVLLLALVLFAGPSVAVLGADMALIYAVDLSLYVDAVLATTIAASASRVKTLWWLFRERAAFLRAPLRRRRTPALGCTSRLHASPEAGEEPSRPREPLAV